MKKTSKLSLKNIEDPYIKTKRERAKRFSTTESLSQWIELLANLVSVVGIFTILILMGFYHLCIIITVIILFQMKLSQWTSKKAEDIQRRQTSSTRVSDYIIDLLVNRESVQEIRAYKMYSYLKGKMKEIFFKNFRESQKNLVLSESITFFRNSLTALLRGLSILLLVILPSGNALSAGTFVMLFQIVNYLYTMVPSIITTYSNLEGNRMRFEDYSTYLKLEEEPVGQKMPLIENETLSKGMGIKARHLTFKYPTNRQNTLEDIHFTIKPGSSVAFVGENGSGKTTLVKMILGLYKPTSGSIKWFNKNGSIKKQYVANESRVIFQDFIKFLRPVRENVAIGDISMLENDEAIFQALKKADADKFYNDLDTFLGPQFGGLDLSGGQWQRLAIGRAYLKGSSLTIFDEPTASLDPNSEKRAFDLFVSLGEQQTSIIVTHRLYITKFVDEIFMFENGEIVESGTHEELMNAKGKYEKMFKQQSTLYSNNDGEVY